ncbi:3'-5' exonuclease [Jiangella alba]|uniref:Exodeoxyribonuclease X n=1 Tax=Jiangella alba TaxID=561176 RepID=A0A1H5J7T9_9ACTN|nr:3'-5' exonuclease [Jiangella alba]SEE48585.1 exodeoxyribonuclease X [Jiangella alba]
MNDWTSRSYAVVDVEGNGQRPPSLVEVAVAPIDHGVAGPAVSWAIRPPAPITEIARRIHGISNSDVAAQPPISAVADDIAAAMAGRVFVAHAAYVDLGVLTRELPGWGPAAGVVDTLKLSRSLLADAPSHKLTLLAAHLGIAGGLPGLRSHRAGYDATMCARLFVYLAELPGGADAITTSLGEDGADDALF